MLTDVRYLHSARWLQEKTGMSLRTIYDQITRGVIPSVVIDGKIMINEVELPDKIKIKINNHNAEPKKTD